MKVFRVLGSSCSRRHRLCVAMILGAEEKRQPKRKATEEKWYRTTTLTCHTCQHPCQHLVNSKFEDRDLPQWVNRTSAKQRHAYRHAYPQKYLVVVKKLAADCQEKIKKLAADCQEKTKMLAANCQEGTKKLAAPVINTGLRPVYRPASSSFTQHTPTLRQHLPQLSSLFFIHTTHPTTTNDNTFLVHMPFHNYPPSSSTLPHSHNNQRQHCNAFLVRTPLHNMFVRYVDTVVAYSVISFLPSFPLPPRFAPPRRSRDWK